MESRHRRLLPVTLILIITALRNSHASTVNTDTANTGTISGKSNGISISTSIFMAPDASLTLQGPSGYITAASSISAASFFGDGSHLSGTSSIVLGATQTFHGTNIFSSEFRVQSNGGQISLSTGGARSNLSIDSAGVTTFFPQLHNSSATALSTYATTISSFGPCVTGSTLTITTSGGRLEVYFTGDLTDDYTGNSVNSPGASFLVDGAFVNDMSQQKGFRYEYNGFGGVLDYTTSFDYLTDALPPGTHSICLTIAGIDTNSPGNGTTRLYGTQAGTISNGNIFYVKEIK